MSDFIGGQVGTDNSTYVDDVYRSLAKETAALQLLEELPRMLARGGFWLTKLISNSPTVLNQIPENERAPGVSWKMGRLKALILP